MIKRIWPDIKWLFNYMMSIVMYAIIVVLILVGAILLAYFLDVTKRGNSAEWQPPLYGAYVIVSGSMHPSIKVNDAIIIKRTDSTDIQIGDVVTYRSLDPSYYGIMITHRVIDIVSEDGEIKYEHTWNFGLENYSSDRKELEADRIQMYYICKLLDTYDTTKFVGKHVKLVFADNKCTHLFGISNEIGNMFVIPDNLFIHNDLKDTDNLYSLSEVYSMIHYAKTTKNFIF